MNRPTIFPIGHESRTVDLRVTDASWHWLTEIGHTDHCLCPSDSRVHRSLTLRPAIEGGYLPRCGYRKHIVPVSETDTYAIATCADMAFMLADEADCYPPAALRSLRALADRALDAYRTLKHQRLLRESLAR